MQLVLFTVQDDGTPGGIVTSNNNVTSTIASHSTSSVTPAVTTDRNDEKDRTSVTVVEGENTDHDTITGTYHTSTQVFFFTNSCCCYGFQHCLLEYSVMIL